MNGNCQARKSDQCSTHVTAAASADTADGSVVGNRDALIFYANSAYVTYTLYTLHIHVVVVYIGIRCIRKY